MTTPAVETSEKPLSRPAKFGLIITAALVILLFYLFCLGSVLLLLACLAGEAIIFAVLIRFGVSRVMIPHLRRHSSLLILFFRSFWTRKQAEFKVPLTQPDAPELFVFLHQLSARLNVPPPREVRIEMNAGAWVSLNGFRRGAKATTLGLGYDLIAGLTERELEAVVAHEMTHAKLVRRGLKRWLRSGLHRASNLDYALSSLAGAYRRSQLNFALCEGLLNISDRCTRLAARLVATYSRQDEFDADRGAAETCGSMHIRTSLLKLDDMFAKSARIGWNERVALLQRGTGFSSWLVEELAAVGSVATTTLPPPARGIDRYSTHPSTTDRIAALPPDAPDASTEPSRPAMQLFADPDAVAAKVVAEVLRVLRIQEKRDTRRLRRWVRRQQRGATIRPTQWGGVLIGAAALIVAIGAWADDFHSNRNVLGGCLVGLLVAAAVYRLGRYRAKVALPIPDYEILHAAWENPDDPETREHREEELFGSIRDASAGMRFRDKRAYLISQSFAALAKCDYLRAHVAARQCVKLDGKCVEALLALAIASAAFHNHSQTRTMLGSIQRITGLHSRSVGWGVGWALFLLQDWYGAEAFLAAASKQSPEPTFEALLALSQSHRDKLQGAIIHARVVLAAGPTRPERIQLVANLLLDGGNLIEAQELLAQAGIAVQGNPALMQCMVRLYLLQRNFPLADKWLEALRQQGIKGPVGIQLGSACETARRDDQAANFYSAALRSGFYPEAHLGLSRLAIHRKDHPAAKKHIVAALNLDFTPGPKARTPLDLFTQVLGHIIQLEVPIMDARAWTATISQATIAGPMAKHTFLIFARDADHAESFLKVIVDGLKPGQPSLLPTYVTWKEAHRDQQPAGSVRPGIQSFWK